MPSAPLAFALPVALLFLQCALFWLLPAPLPSQAAYIFMVVAPALAALAALRRGMHERSSARLGWLAVALAMAIWAVGAFGNLWQEMVLGRLDEMYRDSILAFNLAIVPVTFLLAGEWGDGGRRLVRVVDAVMSLALGYGYFFFTWSMLTARGAPDEAGVRALLWLMDAQNLFVAIGALIRWRAAEDGKERELFRALSAYTVSYFVIAFVNNHFIAAQPDFGPQESSVVTVVFALVIGLALRAPSTNAGRVWSRGFSRTVRSASPLFLAGTLLIVSLFLIRADYVLGSAGILIAVLGYGLRSTVTQVHHIEHEDELQRDRSELEAIAWTDALTGLANRRHLDHALRGALKGAQHEGPRGNRPLSVLMIDIDHFKLLNDRYGHPVGDTCLREVALVLRRALVRPADMLARYGGEEFIALLHDTDAAAAAIVAERLRQAVLSLGIDNLDSHFGVVTVSVGVASAMLSNGGTAAALVAAADRALYDAKCAGRNQVKAWDARTPLPLPEASAQEACGVRVDPYAAGEKVDRRGPNRATNVVRPAFRDRNSAPGNHTGTDEWESF